VQPLNAPAITLPAEPILEATRTCRLFRLLPLLGLSWSPKRLCPFERTSFSQFGTLLLPIFFPFLSFSATPSSLVFGSPSKFPRISTPIGFSGSGCRLGTVCLDLSHDGLY